MKILHTSDWHLGRTIYGQKCYEEYDAALQWLADLIESEQVDTLLIAGDVFDNSLPNSRAQSQYFRFLARIIRSSCRNVVIVAGNHDSPSLLDAPGEILQALNVHVVGTASDESPENEVIVLENGARRSEAVICAVPYLPDRVLRKVEAGETPEIKCEKIKKGIEEHYRKVIALAEKKRDSLRCAAEDEAYIPIIAMGHLFAVGGQTLQDDGVRELYVGTLAAVETSVFSSTVDYAALGHLHIPQAVGGKPHIRYSGSLLPVGFSAAEREKKAVLIDFSGEKPLIRERTIPRFLELERVTGTYEQIVERIEELKRLDRKILLEIVYADKDFISDLRGKIENSIERSKLILCRMILSGPNEGDAQNVFDSAETLGDLTEEQVFQKFLESRQVADDLRGRLTALYREIVQTVQTQDRRGTEEPL